MLRDKRSIHRGLLAGLLGLAAAAVLAGCDRADFGLGKGKAGADAGDDEAVRNKSTGNGGGSGGWPTEQSEGVVGYLVDPARISSSVDGARIVVVGEAGALTPAEADASGLAAYALWSVTTEELAAAVSGAELPPRIEARVLAAGALSPEDGAFELELARDQVPDGAKLVLTFNAQATEALLPGELGGAPILFKAPDVPGAFAVLAPGGEAAQAVIDEAARRAGPPLAAWQCTANAVGAKAVSKWPLAALEPRFSESLTLHLRPPSSHCTYVDIYVRVASLSSGREAALVCDGVRCGAKQSFRVNVGSKFKWKITPAQLAALVADRNSAKPYEIVVGAAGGGVCNGAGLASYGVAVAVTLGDDAPPAAGEGPCGAYNLK